MEIPLDYNFYEDSGETTWLKKALEKVDNSLGCQIKTLENRFFFLFFHKKYGVSAIKR